MKLITPLKKEDKKLVNKENKDLMKSIKSIFTEVDLNYFFSDSWKKASKFHIKIQGICNVALKKGVEQFQPTLDILKNFEGMNELEFREDLCLEIPNSLEEVTKRENVSQLLFNLEKIGKYKNIAFHYDIGIKNPSLSIVLQIVDDSPFRGNRRNNILNSDYSYIGISSKLVNGYLCSYFTFASSNE